MADNRVVPFALNKITTEQFAMLEEQASDAEEINIQTNIRFGADSQSRQIAVFAAFIFENKKQAFLVVEAGCHFSIEPAAWAAMQNKPKQLSVDAGLLQHLTALTVGTTRGILHAKTENTSFNRFFLPTVNVADLIGEDVCFDLEA